jgi:hypothetical protein
MGFRIPLKPRGWNLIPLEPCPRDSQGFTRDLVSVYFPPKTDEAIGVRIAIIALNLSPQFIEVKTHSCPIPPVCGFRLAAKLIPSIG